MRVRPYQEHDLPRLQQIHAAQGFAYPFPDLTNPLFLTKLVLLENDPKGPSPAGKYELGSEAQPCANSPSADQKIVGAALLRLTAEAYLLLDPSTASPRQRWHSLLALHAATEREAWNRGLEDVHAWLPPPIAEKFGKHLNRLGWLRDDTWTPYCRRLAPG